MTGRIDDAEQDYRASIDHIHKIINLLQANPRIENVVALKMPVDLRSESKFSTESGVEMKRRKESDASGVFRLEIIMKEPNNV